MNTFDGWSISKKQRSNYIAVLAVGVVGMLAFTTSAQAVDTTIHAASLCRAENGADITKIKAEATQIINTSSATVVVTCPLIRQTQANTGLQSSFVDILGAPFGAMSCTIYSVEWTGAILGSTTATNSGNSIALGGPTVSSTYSHYALRCSMPANSRIVNIVVTEN